MQKKIVVHMYLKNGKAVTGFDGKELLEDGDVMNFLFTFNFYEREKSTLRGGFFIAG